MRTVVIEIPGLLDATHAVGTEHPIHALHLPSLERLLARADVVQPGKHVSGLADLELQGEANPAVAAEFLKLGSTSGAATFWLRADPMELQADTHALYVSGNRHLTLHPADLHQLAQAVNPLLQDISACWYPVSGWEGYLAVSTLPKLELTPAITAFGRDHLKSVPRGRDSGRWQQLLTEIQMTLNTLPLNVRRRERGTAAVNSLYLWGLTSSQDAPGAASPPVFRDDVEAASVLVVSDSAMILGETCRHGAQVEWAPDSWAALSVPNGIDQFHLVITELAWLRRQGLVSQWQERLLELAHGWLEPLLEELRAGNIESLLLLPGGDSNYRLKRRHLRRFWRRTRPLKALCRP